MHKTKSLRIVANDRLACCLHAGRAIVEKKTFVEFHFKDVFSFFGENEYVEKEADGQIATERSLKGWHRQGSLDRQALF